MIKESIKNPDGTLVNEKEYTDEEFQNMIEQMKGYDSAFADRMQIFLDKGKNLDLAIIHRDENGREEARDTKKTNTEHTRRNSSRNKATG